MRAHSIQPHQPTLAVSNASVTDAADAEEDVAW